MVVLTSCKHFEVSNVSIYIPYFQEHRAKHKVVIKEKPLTFGDAPVPYTDINDLPSLACGPMEQVQDMIREWNDQNKIIELQNNKISELENNVLHLQNQLDGGQ